MNIMRPSLGLLPRRMAKLPIDERGFVVPWFVDYVDGKPEFRAMNPEKWKRAVRERLCWVCGEKLGKYMTFVLGPMCGINRVSSEPPSHLECAEWSAKNCPFLSNPEQVRRQDEIVNAASKMAGGIGILRNPGVAMLWTCKDYNLYPDGKGGVLINMGEPEHVLWFREGRPATRAEVMESVETGFPALVNAARIEGETSLKLLDEARGMFTKYLPMS